MKDIIEIAKSLKDSGFLLKGVSETIQNEANEQKGGFLSMLLGTLGASLLGNTLAGKGINRMGEGAKSKEDQGRDKVNETRSKNCKSRSWKLKTRSQKQTGFLMPPHPLTNFEIQKYYHIIKDLMTFILEIIYPK